MDENTSVTAAEADQGVKQKKGRFERKLVLPTKTQINFATVGITPMKLSVLLPGIVLIIVGASLLSKFFVVDRIVEVSNLQSEVAGLQSQIDSDQAAIDEMGDIAVQYAHYTWSGMTEEERNLSDRMDALLLIDWYVRSKAKVGSYTISGNEISLPITGVTFNEIGTIVTNLENDRHVDHCEVVAAASDDSGQVYDSADTDVTMIGGDKEATAQVTIYLYDNPVDEDDAWLKEGASEKTVEEETSEEATETTEEESGEDTAKKTSKDKKKASKDKKKAAKDSEKKASKSESEEAAE